MSLLKPKFLALMTVHRFTKQRKMEVSTKFVDNECSVQMHSRFYLVFIKTIDGKPTLSSQYHGSEGCNGVVSSHSMYTLLKVCWKLKEISQTYFQVLCSNGKCTTIFFPNPIISTTSQVQTPWNLGLFVYRTCAFHVLCKGIVLKIIPLPKYANC